LSIFIDVRKKEKVIQAHNVTLLLLSRGGYCKLEEAMMREKKKAQLHVTDNDIGVTPPSPPSRHQKWKQGHMKKMGEYSYEKSQIV